MNSNSKYRDIAVLAFLLFLLFAGIQAHAIEGLARWANPLLGVSNRTFPGAALPFGMVQFSMGPDNNGFALTQFSGAGCKAMGNFPIKVQSGEASTPGISPSIDHSTQEASPGYYRAVLTNGVVIELTATMRTGMARVTFPGDRGSVIIDVARQATNTVSTGAVVDNNNMVFGSVSGGTFCKVAEWGTPYSPKDHNKYEIHAAAQFNRVPAAIGTFNGSSRRQGVSTAQGTDCGAYATFDTRQDRVVLLKVGLSYTSQEGALANLDAENAGWDFDQVRAAARDQWEQRFSRIQVSGGTDADRIVFYTALYHSLLHPNVFNDVNGDYIGFDNQIHSSAGRTVYANFSGWDVYRCQVQLLALLDPTMASDFIRSLVRNTQQGGGAFGRWLVANDDSGIMIGEPTTPSIAAMYGFGATDIDLDATLTAMHANANTPGLVSTRNSVVRPHLAEYLRLGYTYGADLVCEYGITDFAMGMFMVLTNQDEEQFRTYLRRSQGWRHVYDPTTKWLRCRRNTGEWLDPNIAWTEGTKEQYFWLVPHNLRGLIDTIGGDAAANERLDTHFREVVGGFESTHYNQGNEIGLHVPWLYNWTGQPHKTQAVVRRIALETYSHTLDVQYQLPGDDDLGTMSAWLVLASLGMYPSIPGLPGFALSGPLFDDITLTLGNNSVVRIQGGSSGRTDANKYVQSLTIDGVNHDASWLDWSSIASGATLNYVMGPQPSNWAARFQPPSFNEQSAMPIITATPVAKQVHSLAHKPAYVSPRLMPTFGRKLLPGTPVVTIHGRRFEAIQGSAVAAGVLIVPRVGGRSR